METLAKMVEKCFDTGDFSEFVEEMDAAIGLVALTEDEYAANGMHREAILADALGTTIAALGFVAVTASVKLHAASR